jgi:hypothetical protein
MNCFLFSLINAIFGFARFLSVISDFVGLLLIRHSSRTKEEGHSGICLSRESFLSVLSGYPLVDLLATYALGSFVRTSFNGCYSPFLCYLDNFTFPSYVVGLILKRGCCDCYSICSMFLRKFLKISGLVTAIDYWLRPHGAVKSENP